MQSCWDQQGEDGAILLGVMLGGEASTVDSWVSRYGVTYPMMADPAGTMKPGFNGGYPTYPVIGPDMTILNNDLFPFNCGRLEGYL